MKVMKTDYYAVAQKLKYQAAYESLRKIKENIVSEQNNRINSSFFSEATFLSCSTLSGAYYDAYVEKHKEWNSQYDKIKNGFVEALADLTVCISNASEKVGYWSARTQKEVEVEENE